MRRVAAVLAPVLAVALIACTASAPPDGAPAAAAPEAPGWGAAAAGQGTPVCGDFLAALGRKPAGVEYVGCGGNPERQGKPLRALYRVPSAQAAAVEDYLVGAVGLARLRRSCCQWDGPPAAVQDAGGRTYTISMTSPETIAPDRASWPQATAFQIVVETLTEEI